MIDLIRDPINPLLPPEWSAIPEELLVQLAPPDTFVMTPAQRAALNRIAAGRWFLVRNLWGERCESCRPYPGSTILGAVHRYMTISCKEAPFNGLRQIYAWIESYEEVEVRNGIYKAIRQFMVEHPTEDAFVPISERDALILNQRIRDHGGQPVIDQRPLRQDEIDEVAMRRRLVEKSRRIRRATAQLEAQGLA